MATAMVMTIKPSSKFVQLLKSKRVSISPRSY